MMSFFRIITVSIFFPVVGVSQSVLTLDVAVETGIENNLNIEVAEMEQLAAEMQVYRANAGFGPVLNLNAAARATGNRVQQNFIDGRVVDRFGRSYSPNISLNLDWVLYDGGRMHTLFDRLKVMSRVSDLQTQLQIEDVVVQIMRAYFEVMQLGARVEFLNTVIANYEDRLRITEERWQVGRGSKLDYLQSKTDLNAQLSQKTAAINNFENAKISLNGLLVRDLTLDYQVEKEVQINERYELSELVQQAAEKNRDVLLLRKMYDMNVLSEKEIETRRKPQVRFSSSLGFAYTNTNAGFLLSNQNAALSSGVSASWNLYDGKHTKNQLAIAKVNSRSLQMQEEALLQEINTLLTSAYNEYNTNKRLLELEEENRLLAEENLQISLEKFRLGDSTILELNEAQRTYDTALNRLVLVQHSVRLSELRLLQLSGGLVH